MTSIPVKIEGGKRLERWVSEMGQTFIPVLDSLKAGGKARRGSLIGGAPFTSENFPWPGESRCPDAPVVQLDLAEISDATGVDVGAGLLQVWRPVGHHLGHPFSGPFPRTPEVRLIPAVSVRHTSRLTSRPRVYTSCWHDPNYSWGLSPLTKPMAIIGWREGGPALPDPEFISWEMLEALGETNAELLGRATRLDCRIELFGAPVPGKEYFRLARQWKVLASIYGPLHRVGPPLRQYDPDFFQIFWHKKFSGDYEYRGYWWCEFF